MALSETLFGFSTAVRTVNIANVLQAQLLPDAIIQVKSLIIEG